MGRRHAQGDSPSAGSGGGGPPTPRRPPATTDGDLLTPPGVSTFNVLGTDTEDAVQAPHAIDGDPHTYWSTHYYFQPNFGGLKQAPG